MPAAHLLEGYGITECSPVITVCRAENNRPGTVGQPLDGVELCVVDLDSGETLAPGQQGMLLVSGQSVFPGYIGENVEPPFRELHGKRWYVTGDLVEVDADKFVTFKGRLKRFLKAGGEMISLPALEEPFTQAYPNSDEGPRRRGGGGLKTAAAARIVLFTTEPITLVEANNRLKEAGFPGHSALDEVRRVEPHFRRWGRARWIIRCYRKRQSGIFAC